MFDHECVVALSETFFFLVAGINSTFFLELGSHRYVRT